MIGKPRFRHVWIASLLILLTACSGNETNTPIGEILPTDGLTSTEAPIDDPAGTQTATIPTATFESTTQVPESTQGGAPATGQSADSGSRL